MDNFMKNMVLDLNEKTLIRPLISQSSFIASLQTDNNEIIFKLDNQQFSVVESIENCQEIDVQITGDKQIVHNILCGKVLIREAIKQKQITVTATFRKILLLESIFFLLYTNKLSTIN